MLLTRKYFKVMDKWVEKKTNDHLLTKYDKIVFQFGSSSEMIDFLELFPKIIIYINPNIVTTHLIFRGGWAIK